MRGRQKILPGGRAVVVMSFVWAGAVAAIAKNGRKQAPRLCLGMTTRKAKATAEVDSLRV